MRTETTATARVTVTMELDGGGPWGEDCKLDQVYKQAKDHALSELRRLQAAGEKAEYGAIRFRVVGEPAVTMVLAERKR